MRRSSKARKVLRELDAELDAASKATGRSLVWTATDRELLTLIADSIDRKVQLRHEYDASENVAERVKLSAEVRLLENSVARLLKQVRFDVPAAPAREPSHVVSAKASRAAKARWYPGAS